MGYGVNGELWDIFIKSRRLTPFTFWWQDDIESNEKFQALQEELIAVKLREAESNLALRELSNHVSELDKDWQVCVDLLTTWCCVVDWGIKPHFSISILRIIWCCTIRVSHYRSQYLPFLSSCLLCLYFKFMCRKIIISICFFCALHIHDLKVTCRWLVSVMLLHLWV